VIGSVLASSTKDTKAGNAAVNALTSVWEWFVEYALTIGLTIGFSLLLWWICIRVIRRVTEQAKKRLRQDRPGQARAAEHTQELTAVLMTARREQRAEALGQLMRSIVTFTIFGLGILVVLAQAGVNLTPILASAGVVGVALGLVLDHAGMKAFHAAVDRTALGVKALVADTLPAGYPPAQAGHRQAALPALFFLAAQRRDHGVDQHGARHQRRIRVAHIGLVTAKNHHLQIDPDLRRGQSSAVGRMHGVEQVNDQAMERGGVKGLHRLGQAQQARIAHFENFTHRHLATPSIALHR